MPGNEPRKDPTPLGAKCIFGLLTDAPLKPIIQDSSKLMV